MCSDIFLAISAKAMFWPPYDLQQWGEDSLPMNSAQNNSNLIISLVIVSRTLQICQVLNIQEFKLDEAEMGFETGVV